MRRDIESLDIDAIHIGERMRPVADDSRVAALASSIKDIGLQTPISVRIVEKVEIDDEEVWHVPVLIAGRNRIQAARQLGWERIDCFIMASDDIEAQLWEIAENLHRVGLTKEERDEHIRRYAKLLEEREAEAKRSLEIQTGQPVRIESKRDDGRGHRPKEVAAKIAEETGLSQRTVRRALAPSDPDRALDRERMKQEAAEREREAKEARERAKIAVCDFLLDKLAMTDWDRLIGLLDAAGPLRSSDLRDWQSPSEAA